jgi:endonuclease/exonuclease/phosphatase family metal-dependent hydrolase
MTGCRTRRPHLCWALGVGLCMLLWLPNVSRPARPVRGDLPSTDTWFPDGNPTLRVLQLNTLHGFPRFEHLDERLDLIAETLVRENPDIVCLQEAGWTPIRGSSARHLAASAGYDFVYARANGNRWAILFEEGEAILSRYPILEADVVELRPRAGWFEHRLALQAVVETPLGAILVISTHLTNGKEDVNAAQAAALATLVSESPFPTLVCGDLNAVEDSTQMVVLHESMVDAFRALHPDDAGLTCCSDDLTDPNQVLTKRIDYVLVARTNLDGLHIAKAWVVLDRAQSVEGQTLWASDHAGVVVELVRRD